MEQMSRVKYAPAEEKFNMERGEGLTRLIEIVRNWRTYDPDLLDLVQSEVKACQDFYAQHLVLDHIVETIRANAGRPTNRLVALYSTMCAAKVAWVQARKAEAEAEAQPQAQPQHACQSARDHICPSSQGQAGAHASPQASPQADLKVQTPLTPSAASSASSASSASTASTASMQTQPNPQSSRASANIPDDTLAELEHQLQAIDKSISVRVSPQTSTLEELRSHKKNIEELIATRREELKRG